MCCAGRQARSSTSRRSWCCRKEGVRIVDIVMQVAPARHCGETD
ncbi:MAG: hypothetical protein ACLR7Z_01745 [Bilophila wadsworthia]